MTILFICGIYSSLINKFGEYLAESFDNIIEIYFFIGLILLCFLIFFIYFMKFKIIKLIVSLIFITSLTVLFIFIPFKNGKRIMQLKEFGFKCVNCLEIFQEINGEYPKNLDLLYPTCLNLDDLKLIENSVKYTVFKKDTLNDLRKTLKQPTIDNDYFFLSIYEDFMDYEHLSYRKKENEFIFTDD